MPNTIAVVICNYNKRDYLCKCIDSVLNSTYKDVDIIVVDNASADDSVACVRTRYTDITLIENEQNLGGSGGFNAGLRYACEKNYQYIVLLDNDAFLKEDALANFVIFMDQHEDVAIAGAKIYLAGSPNLLQEFGSDIDFTSYNIKSYYKNCDGNAEMPRNKYCDYVPLCAVIVRKKAIDDIGLMTECNFLYWDDIEWGFRFNLGGYKVCAIADAVAWHKMGTANRTSTLPSYYFWRNRIRFFAEYLPTEQLESFCRYLLKEFYRATSACILNERFNMAQTLQNALYDALYGVVGKSDVVLANDAVSEKRAALLSRKHDPGIKYVRHIFDEDSYSDDLIYIDAYKNIVCDDAGRRFCRNYQAACEHFVLANLGFVYQKLVAITC